jgi:hypothetical protein
VAAPFPKEHLFQRRAATEGRPYNYFFVKFH